MVVFCIAFQMSEMMMRMETLGIADSWVWDEEHKSSEVVLSPDRQAAYFHVDPFVASKGTAGECEHFPSSFPQLT